MVLPRGCNVCQSPISMIFIEHILPNLRATPLKQNWKKKKKKKSEGVSRNLALKKTQLWRVFHWCCKFQRDNVNAWSWPGWGLWWTEHRSQLKVAAAHFQVTCGPSADRPADFFQQKWGFFPLWNQLIFKERVTTFLTVYKEYKTCLWVASLSPLSYHEEYQILLYVSVRMLWAANSTDNETFTSSPSSPRVGSVAQ